MLSRYLKKFIFEGCKIIGLPTKVIISLFGFAANAHCSAYLETHHHTFCYFRKLILLPSESGDNKKEERGPKAVKHSTFFDNSDF